MGTNNFLLLGDVARKLDCKPYRIVYLLTAGHVPEPATRIGNRRMFTGEDIERINAKLTTEEKDELLDNEADWDAIRHH
jgi:DNA-binding transcriptional MerR regulator